jgi:hypothetical protein
MARQKPHGAEWIPTQIQISFRIREIIECRPRKVTTRPLSNRGKATKKPGGRETTLESRESNSAPRGQENHSRTEGRLQAPRRVTIQNRKDLGAMCGGPFQPPAALPPPACLRLAPALLSLVVLLLTPLPVASSSFWPFLLGVIVSMLL